MVVVFVFTRAHRIGTESGATVGGVLIILYASILLTFNTLL